MNIDAPRYSTKNRRKNHVFAWYDMTYTCIHAYMVLSKIQQQNNLNRNDRYIGDKNTPIYPKPIFQFISDPKNLH
jgi:hypothetical protein